MRSEIIELISKLGDFSLTGIKNQLPQARGEYNFMFPAKGVENTNILLCAGVSSKFIRTMMDLINDKVLTFEPVSKFVLMADGGESYDLPIAEPPKVKYDELHFLPLLIKRGENYLT